MGRNDTLRVFEVPFDDIEDGILAFPKIAGDPAIIASFLNSGKNPRRKFV